MNALEKPWCALHSMDQMLGLEESGYRGLALLREGMRLITKEVVGASHRSMGLHPLGRHTCSREYDACEEVFFQET